MAYQSFHPGEVSFAEILTQLNTFTNDGGNVFERAMVVSNLRSFFMDATKKSITGKPADSNISKFKVEMLRCRRDGTSYIGFGKNDTLVECSKDPGAFGTAVLARDIKTNKPFYGMNFIVSPDLSKKIFGDEDIIMIVKAVCDESPNDEKKKEELPKKPEQPKEPESKLSVPENDKENDDQVPPDSSNNQTDGTETKTEESQISVPDKDQEPEKLGSVAQTVKTGMVPMAPVRQGKHGNKK